METTSLEVLIRQHCPWEQLPPGVRQSFDNTRALWEKEVCAFSLKNQLPWRTSLVRKLYTDERKYYTEMLKTSRDRLMLFPYHLSESIVPALRVTPFRYYLEIMHDLMLRERTYDTLPNFTAKDCLLHLGIGRNEYIEKMNRSKSMMRYGLWNLVARRKTILWELLPTEPVDARLEPWWVVHSAVPTLEAAMEALRDASEEDLQCARRLYKARSLLAAELDWRIVRRLFKKGLVYLDVPIRETDHVVVPPLEGFVMNRVQGDYFETLLYKIFVSIDETTSIAELSNILQIDVSTALDAVSLYCRLGFAFKKSVELVNSAGQPVVPHPSWSDTDGMLSTRSRLDVYAAREPLSESMSVSPLGRRTSIPGLGSDTDSDDDDVAPPTSSVPPLSTMAAAAGGGKEDVADGFAARGRPARPSAAASLTSSTGAGSVVDTAGAPATKRIGFLFDATLTAFLMMGNLSMSLKSHAVTMFEVGKLANESLTSFMDELSKIQPVSANDGEAQRYFDHAVILFKTINFLRGDASAGGAVPGILANASGVDLIRFESLSSLDVAARQRVLMRSYNVLVSMAPVVPDCRTLRSCVPCHFGPPIPEMTSSWFKLFLYTTTGRGPPTVLCARGARMRRLPEAFSAFEELLVTPWNQEGQVHAAASALVSINDLLCDGAVMVQGYCTTATAVAASNEDEPEEPSRDIALPILDNETWDDDSTRETMSKIVEQFPCQLSVGYVRLLKLDSGWVPLDMHFGIPLFDRTLNEDVCRRAAKAGTFASAETLRKHAREQRGLALRLLTFVESYQHQFSRFSAFPNDIEDISPPQPGTNLLFDKGILSVYDM